MADRAFQIRHNFPFTSLHSAGVGVEILQMFQNVIILLPIFQT
jgi:hypothetical protein